MSFSTLTRVSNAITESISSTFFPVNTPSSVAESKSPQQILQAATLPEQSAPTASPPSQVSPVPHQHTMMSLFTSFMRQMNRKLKGSRHRRDEHADNGDDGGCDEFLDTPFSWQQTLIMGAVLAALLYGQVYVLQMTYNAAFPDMLQGSTTFSKMTMSRAFSLWLFVQILFSGI